MAYKINLSKVNQLKLQVTWLQQHYNLEYLNVK